MIIIYGQKNICFKTNTTGLTTSKLSISRPLRIGGGLDRQLYFNYTMLCIGWEISGHYAVKTPKIICL